MRSDERISPSASEPPVASLMLAPGATSTRVMVPPPVGRISMTAFVSSTAPTMPLASVSPPVAGEESAWGEASDADAVGEGALPTVDAGVSDRGASASLAQAAATAEISAMTTSAVRIIEGYTISRCSPSGMRSDEDHGRISLEDAVGHAAQRCARDACPGVRRHNNQVDVLLVDEIK
jgi:hypothetical protein